MIAPETIEQVRSRTNLVAVIGETVKLVRKGRSHMGLCPFHQEKTPSFSVNEERGFYHCFGCGVSGDAIKFVQETQSLSFVEAVRWLAERAGIEIVETGSEIERRQAAEARRRLDELYEVGNVAAAFFERMLTEHSLASLARRELGRRGLHPQSADEPIDPVARGALEAFRIGYAPYGWDGLASHLRQHKVSHQAAEKVGLLAPRRSGSGHYDRFRHRLVFAVLDMRGRVIAFSGRSVDDPTPDELDQAGLEALTSGGDPPPKYVNSPESPVYKKGEAVFGLNQARQAIVASGECVVVEGNFDVLSLHARGVANVVAPLGTAFTEEQALQIKRYAQRVTLLFDGDEAGARAVKKAREPCRKAGLLCRVAVLPGGTDPDDLVRRAGAEGVRRVLSSARSMLEYLIDCELDSGFSSADAQARGRKIAAVTALIKEEDDPNVRAMAQAHADRIAERLGIADANTFRALSASVRQALSETRAPAPRGRAPARPERARSSPDAEAVAREVFGIFLDFPDLLDTREGIETSRMLEGDVAAAVASLRMAATHEGDFEDVERVLSQLPRAVYELAAARLAAPRFERDELSAARAELKANARKLERQELRRSRADAYDELQKAASSGDEDAEIALLRERAARAKRRHGID